MLRSLTSATLFFFALSTNVSLAQPIGNPPIGTGPAARSSYDLTISYDFTNLKLTPPGDALSIACGLDEDLGKFGSSHYGAAETVVSSANSNPYANGSGKIVLHVFRAITFVDYKPANMIATCDLKQPGWFWAAASGPFPLAQGQFALALSYKGSGPYVTVSPAPVSNPGALASFPLGSYTLDVPVDIKQLALHGSSASLTCTLDEYLRGQQAPARYNEVTVPLVAQPNAATLSRSGTIAVAVARDPSAPSPNNVEHLGYSCFLSVGGAFVHAAAGSVTQVTGTIPTATATTTTTPIVWSGS